MKEQQTTRRDFLKTCGTCLGAAAVVGVGGSLVAGRADADKVWQLDASICDTCVKVVSQKCDFKDPSAWGRCATECVLKNSAVKAVNDFTQCGYCLICPAYHDVTSEPDPEDGTFKGRICPQDAIIRTPVGYLDPSDPNNNYYQYTIDEAKCNGCGRCVKGCKPPFGNGSMRLEVRHSLCADCNQCRIAVNCPPKAFFRSPVQVAHGGAAGGYCRPAPGLPSPGGHSGDARQQG